MALILFDFDGVLADTLGDMIQFAQEVCDELGVKHIVVQNDLKNLEVMSFATYGRACEIPEHLVNEFVHRCLKRFAKKKSPPDIFKGLDEVIKKLSDNNIIAIVTGNNTDNVNAFLVEHRLDGHVSAIYGVDLPGSKAEKISLARSQFAKNGEFVFMVGDTLSDARAAKEASVKSITVSWGHQNAEMLIRTESDYFVDSPRELFETITKAENQSGSW
jgi:phosphoglycolate phosphatase-like HAD superfamily hydrolase